MAFDHDDSVVLSKTDLTLSAPEPAIGPSHERVFLARGDLGDERKREPLQRNGIPAVAELSDGPAEPVETDPLGGGREIAEDHTHRQRELLFEPNDHLSPPRRRSGLSLVIVHSSPPVAPSPPRAAPKRDTLRRRAPAGPSAGSRWAPRARALPRRLARQRSQ